MKWLDGITDSMDMSLHKPWEWRTWSLACCSPWGRKESDRTEPLSNNRDETNFSTHPSCGSETRSEGAGQAGNQTGVSSLKKASSLRPGSRAHKPKASSGLAAPPGDRIKTPASESGRAGVAAQPWRFMQMCDTAQPSFSVVTWISYKKRGWEWQKHFLYFCINSITSLHFRVFETPRTVAQAPLSMGVSRQECWSGLPFTPPGDLLDSYIKQLWRLFEIVLKNIYLSIWSIMIAITK